VIEELVGEIRDSAHLGAQADLRTDPATPSAGTESRGSDG
jgi:hypothetical protein